MRSKGGLAILALTMMVVLMAMATWAEAELPSQPGSEGANGMSGQALLELAPDLPNQGPFCRTPAASIPDNDLAGITDTLTVTTTGTILDMDVLVQATHSRMGDLVFTLRHVDTSTSVTIIDRPGYPASADGCDQADVDATLNDEGISGSVENQCSSTAPALFGEPTPNNPLSAVDGEALNGTWEMIVSDRASSNVGSLDQWCLIPNDFEVSVPVVLKDYCNGFNGPSESEPNNSEGTANGPLCSQSVYTGTVEVGVRVEDFFFFDLPTAGTVTVDVTDFLLDGQVFLYADSVAQANQVDWDPPDGIDDDYQVSHTGPARRYFVRVFAPETNPGGTYTLRVTIS